MKFEAEFTTKDKRFPLDYRRVFIHFFKSFLTSENVGKNYDKYYGEASPKSFTYAVFFENPKFTKEKIELEGNNIKLIFSTSDEMTGYIFLAGFLSKKNKRVPLEEDNYMTLKTVRRITQQTTQENKVIIKMNSPLVIREHTKEGNKDKYYSVASEEFAVKAEDTIKAQLKADGFNDECLSGFKIKSLTGKKTVAKFYGCYIESTIGTFLLEGEPIVLNHLIESGMGSRKSAGFGCVEMLTDML